MIRFLNKIKINKETSCWEWTAAKGPNGYGRFYLNNKLEVAHRASYKLFVGNIDKNKNVCHTCDNRKCVNPSHLYLGTQSENMKDCVNKGRLNNHNKAKTHCKNGHKYNYENTYFRKNGSKYCRVCRRK